MPNRQARLPRKRSRNGRNECHHPPACRAKAEGEGEMTEQESEALVDLLFGTTKALEVICRQLIDAKILNAEILIADLEQEKFRFHVEGTLCVKACLGGFRGLHLCPCRGTGTSAIRGSHLSTL